MIKLTEPRAVGVASLQAFFDVPVVMPYTVVSEGATGKSQLFVRPSVWPVNEP